MIDNWHIPGTTVEIYQDIFVPGMIIEWVPSVLALTKPQPGEQVLDVACGTGALTRVAAKAVEPGGYVTGIDINPDMLALARKLTDGQLLNIEWREADAQQIPLGDAVFDIVFCQLGLMFMPDKVTALREMRRVLRPGGRIGVMVWGRIEKCPGQMAMAKTWEKLFGADQAAGFYRQHSVSNPEEVRSYLEAAGFREIDVQRVIGAMRFPSPENLVRSYGALGHFDADEKNQAEAIRAVTEMLQAYMNSDGLVYPIEAVLGKGKR